ncbi:hypothetical protein EES43_13445 [Streptomyces sp. ADI96-02]|nr:hypothetical protein EES43_13445 [Streptomyces sp. ADI96-02]
MSAIGVTTRTRAELQVLVSLLRRLNSPEGQAAPYGILAELREMGDVVRAPWKGYFVTGFDACSQVLRGRDWLRPTSPGRSARGTPRGGTRSPPGR